MALYLVQHGKSLSQETDPEQSLSPEGIAQVKQMAEAAKQGGVRVARIQHSVKNRARQTAELMAASLAPPDGIEERTGLKPMDDVSALAGILSAADHLMLVGHLPFMEKLASALITGTPDRLVVKFQNGCIVCLDQASDGSDWHLRWSLVPEMA